MSAEAPSLPPLWPLDPGHLLHDYCWRCDARGLAMVDDPMMPQGDPIKVCLFCARERNVAMARVAGLGRNFVPVRRPEHGER